MKRTVAILLTVVLCLLAYAALAEDVLPTATVETKSSPLTMRDLPNKDGEPIFDIPKGETVTILTDGAFPLVEYDGNRGFVNGEYLVRDPNAVHEDWMDCGVFSLSPEPYVSMDEIITLKKRIDEFQKNTKNLFVIIFVSKEQISDYHFQEIATSTINDFLGRVMGDEERAAQWVGERPKGVIGVIFNTATISIMTLSDGQAANYLNGDDSEKYWNMLDEAVESNLMQSRGKLFTAYIDAAEKFFK